MNHDQLVLLREFYDALEERDVHDLRRGIMRKADDEEFWFRPGLFDRLLEVTEEILAADQWNAAKIAPREDHRVLMNRVGRARAKDNVSWIDNCPGEMR